MSKRSVLVSVVVLAFGGSAVSGQNEPRGSGEICSLPPDGGPCDGVCPRYFFNADTGQCEGFLFGCCKGNANNFLTREACESVCLANNMGGPGACCFPFGARRCEILTGAVCDATGFALYQGDGTTCSDCPESADGPFGACCGPVLPLLTVSDGDCVVVFTDFASNPASESCTNRLHANYQGDGTDCGTDNMCQPPAPRPFPAISEWGMAAVMLLVLIGLTIKFGALVSRKTV